MDERKNIIELLAALDGCCLDVKEDVERVADYLIAHGVTMQKHGRWLDGRCTNCAEEALEYVDEEGDWIVYTTDYCPNCGADMREVKDVQK